MHRVGDGSVANKKYKYSIGVDGLGSYFPVVPVHYEAAWREPRYSWRSVISLSKISRENLDAWYDDNYHSIDAAYSKQGNASGLMVASMDSYACLFFENYRLEDLSHYNIPKRQILIQREAFVRSSAGRPGKFRCRSNGCYVFLKLPSKKDGSLGYKNIHKLLSYRFKFNDAAVQVKDKVIPLPCSLSNGVEIVCADDNYNSGRRFLAGAKLWQEVPEIMIRVLEQAHKKNRLARATHKNIYDEQDSRVIKAFGAQRNFRGVYDFLIGIDSRLSLAVGVSDKERADALISHIKIITVRGNSLFGSFSREYITQIIGQFQLEKLVEPRQDIHNYFTERTRCKITS